MTTSMSKAMKKVGLSIPVNRRIWDWLKDHGPKTGAEVSSALNIPMSASSSIISQMKTRKMVRVDSKFSEHLGRNVGYYSAVGRSFEVLPVPKKEVAIKPGDVIQMGTQNDPVPVTKTSSEKIDTDELIQTLSVTEAFELYQKLDGMFNRNK